MRSTSANYTISYVDGHAHGHARRALTITANDQTKMYGAANPALTASYSGFVNGDTAASLTTGAGVNDGDVREPRRARTPSRRAVSSSSNYTMSLRRADADGDAAALTVTADDQTQDLRGREPGVDGELQRLRQRRHGGEPDEPPTVSTAARRSSAGTYAITAARRGSGDYTFNYVAGTLTIGKAALTVSGNDASKTYGRRIPLSPVVRGFVNGDTCRGSSAGR